MTLPQKKNSSGTGLFIFSLLLVFLACSTARSETRFNVKNTEAILITAVMAERQDDPVPTGDEALLITDQAEIGKFVKLFDGNSYAVSHACGYHWRLTFVRPSAGPVDVWFNQKCEVFEKNAAEICELVQANFDRVKKNPTHFVTEIGVDVSIQPEDAIRRLGENPLWRVFALGDSDRRLPSVEIEATAATEVPADRRLRNKAKEETRKKAERLLLEEAKRLGRHYTILKSNEIRLSRSMFGGYGGKIEESYRMKIFFSVGTKIDDIEKKFPDAGFVSKHQPEVYFLQLVSTNRFSDSFARRLSEEFSFIKQTFAYTSYPR